MLRDAKTGKDRKKTYTKLTSGQTDFMIFYELPL